MSKSRPRPRKTIDVKYMKDWANNQLARESVTEEFRAGICALIEEALFQTGNYHGFNFIDWAQGGHTQWIADGKPKDNSSYLGPKYKRVYH